MWLLMRYCCLYAISFLSMNASSYELTNIIETTQHSKITWIIEDTYEWQDYINKVSKTTSQDTATIVMRGLEQQGYDLNFVKATGDRAEKILKEEANVCMSNRIKTPKREEFTIFSLPHDLYLGLQLYRISQPAPLSEKVTNDQGEIISLSTLFAHYSDHILAVASGVSYGVGIDKQIAVLNPNNVFIRAGGKRIESLAKMLLKGRVDYIIYYPQDINTINQDKVNLESYTIAGSPPYFLGHVSCAKTTTGKKIITDINKILKQAHQSKDFYFAHEKWLIKGDLPKLRKYYYEVFKYLPNQEKGTH